jgi:hypothetical protein
MSSGFEDLSGAIKIFVKEISKGQENLETIAKEISNRQKDLGELVKTKATETQNLVIEHLDQSNLSLIDKGRQEKVLASLKAAKLNNRRNMIDRPHASTFAWIFQPGLTDRIALSEFEWEWRKSRQPQQMQQNPFYLWCQDATSKIFWISGKAGSGKSTLMKYLVDSDDTKRLLNSASPNTLLLAHFLWAGGIMEERTVKNLLCSLLHQILAKEPTLIASILAKYTIPKDNPDDWSPYELQCSILDMVNLLKRPVCIFIDGLDEIGKDGPDKLLEVINTLLADKYIRLCVSSRPDPAFQKRFGQSKDPVPNLRIQEYTYNDIRCLAEEKLASHLGSPAPRLHSELTDAICAKANGMFLWVVLAVIAIGEGTARDSDANELRQCLDDLPDDLQELYQNMWDRENGKNKFHREDTALCLNLMLEGEDIVPKRILSVWHFLLVRKTRYLDRILNSSTPMEDIKDISAELPDAKRQLENRSAGLLEVREDKGTGLLVVAFIHRSAKEFLVNGSRSILEFDRTTPEFRKYSLLKASIVIPMRYRHLIPMRTMCRHKQDSGKSGLEAEEDRSKPDFQLNRIILDYCENISRLKSYSLLDAESIFRLLQDTKKFYDQTVQRNVHCDFVALTASLGMWEYIYDLMDEFGANGLDGKVSTAYSNYIFAASFGISGVLYNSLWLTIDQDQMKIALRMLQNGINLRHKCVRSQYFRRDLCRIQKSQPVLIGSVQLLATLRLFETPAQIYVYPALIVLAYMVERGYGLDERTVIRLRAYSSGDNGPKFRIEALDKLCESIESQSANGEVAVCFVEVNTIFLLRLLVRAVDGRFSKKDPSLVPARLGFKEGRRYRDNEGEITIQTNDREEFEREIQLKSDKAPVVAAQQLFHAIREGCGGLQPFCSFLAFCERSGKTGSLALATLTPNDKDYLSEGLGVRKAYTERDPHGFAGWCSFPILSKRLQEIRAMDHVKWELLEEPEVLKRLEVVEKGYCVHQDDEICTVPDPFQ